MTGVSPLPLSPADFVGERRRRRRERLVRGSVFGAASLSVVISFAIIGTLVIKAWSYIATVEWGSLISKGWFPREGEFDLRTIIWGSVVVTFVAMAFAAPVGLGSAVYLSEYASPRVRRIVKPVLEILAGMPSVVIGFFVLNFVNPGVIQKVFTGAERGNLVAAGIGVGILVVPIVASVAEDALRSVPDDLREASIGLGARKRTTSLSVVLPAAVSGIVAALIVGISRALGETLVVTLAGGAAGASAFGLDPTHAGLTMTSAIAGLASGSDNIVGQDNAFDSLYFVGLLLFAFTFGLNLLANRFVRRVRHAY